MRTANAPELYCPLCGRSETPTLLTLARWERLGEGPLGMAAVCPECASSHEDWKSRARDEVAALALPPDSGRRRFGFFRRRTRP